MNRIKALDRALCLPFLEVAALASGQIIIAVSKVPVQEKWSFLLYPVRKTNFKLDSYSQSFLVPAQVLLADSKSNTQEDEINLTTWAYCEKFKILHDQQKLAQLQHLTVWSYQELSDRFAVHQNLLLAYLRVYLLTNPLTIKPAFIPENKLGKFIGLATYKVAYPISANTETPILNEERFEYQVHKAITFQPFALPPWISKISTLGDRTIEIKEGSKSPHAAGTDFEKIVRYALEFLGFKLEETYQGGSGKLDISCNQPFPLVVECKSGRGIPGHTVYELDKLVDLHKEHDKNQIKKLIIGPGKPSRQLIQLSQQRSISIMKPDTLEKLVKLYARYPGCINLAEFNQICLNPGQIDTQVLNSYLPKVLHTLELRASIIEVLKSHCKKAKVNNVDVQTLCTAYIHSSSSSKFHKDFSYREMQEILIELASPLTGYLGRKKGEDGHDRFYFLRNLDLSIE